MRLRPIAIPFAAALAAVLILSGCAGGGDDQLTLEEYLQRVDELTRRGQNEIEAAGDDASATGEAASSEAESVAALRAFYSDFAATVDRMVAAMRTLKPPSEAEEVHREWLVVAAEIQALLAEFNEQAEDVTSLAEMEQLEAELDDPALGARGDAACLALQALADENDIDADLECEE